MTTWVTKIVQVRKLEIIVSWIIFALRYEIWLWEFCRNLHPIQVSNLCAGNSILMGQQLFSLKHSDQQTAHGKQQSTCPSVDLLLCFLCSACVTIYLNKALVRLTDSFRLKEKSPACSCLSVNWRIYIVGFWLSTRTPQSCILCMCVCVSEYCQERLEMLLLSSLKVSLVE